MADVKIDVARAKTWITKVQQELEETEVTLAEVREKCWSDPTENDIVVCLLKETGELMDDAWKKTNRAFKQAWSALEDGIDELARLGDRIVDYFGDLKTKH